MKNSYLSSKTRSSYHWIHFAAASVLAAALVGCGGGGGGGDSAAAPPAAVVPPAPTTTSIATAAAVATNDTATNPTAVFTVVADSGVMPVTVSSPPKVNFTVISDGAVVKNLTTTNARFILAKLVRGTNGEPDQWVNYVSRTETATPTVGPGGKAALESAKQSIYDSAASATQLVYNDAGYYTYTFTTDIKDTTKTNGVTYEPTLTHRITAWMNYKNSAGETVRVNPYFDFTIDANGNAVAVTDSAKTRKVVDITTCNQCHNKLGMHGGGAVDTQGCVACHNAGLTDANSGNNLDLRTMVHKVHAGRFLHEKGENYVIWGYNNTKFDFSEIGFPANLRNCAICHDTTTKNAAGNPLNPQGDNWKTKPSKEACLSCHKSGTGSNWDNIHVTINRLGASASAISNSTCADCHGAGKQFNAEQVHWIQELENTKLYENKIVSVTMDTAPTATTTGKLTIKYAVINPATGTAYDLREGCAASTTQTDYAGNLIGKTCRTNYRWYTSATAGTAPNIPQDKFGSFGITLATNNLTATTDDTTSTSGGISNAYRGTPDASNIYTATATIPKGAHGNARIVMLGSVAERRVDVVSRAAVGAVPPVGFNDVAIVPVKNAIYEFDLDTGKASTATVARRQIVSNSKCNACHGFLGIPIKPEPGSSVFHSGVRNNSESCEVCHNWARAGSYTSMADGSTFNESWNAKRMIHGIHSGGSTKRTFPFTHGNNYVGAFNKDGTLKADPSIKLQASGGAEVLNFTAEVAYPQRVNNCNACHVNDSWKQNKAVLGSALVSSSLSKNAAGTLYTNPGLDRFLASGACVGQTGTKAGLDLACASVDEMKLPVVSPKAAVCTSCHDDIARQGHVALTGGGGFGKRYDFLTDTWVTLTQADLFAGTVKETCDGCHAVGSSTKPIDKAHGIK